MKRCEEREELIHAYIDNELSSEEMKQLQKHLTACPNCRKMVKIFQGLKITLREKIVPVPAPVSLRARIIKRQFKPASLPRLLLFPRWAYALASMLIILGGIMLYEQGIKPSHFLNLNLYADSEIQEHFDNCCHCQEKAVKLIKGHMKIAQSGKAELQKHLDDCPDCLEEIVRIIKDCLGLLVGNIREESGAEMSFVTAQTLIGRHKSAAGNIYVITGWNVSCDSLKH